MNKKIFLMIIVAVVMAGGAGLAANKWLQAQLLNDTDLRAGMVPVVAAAVEIPFGQKIELSQIKLVELPESSLPTGVFHERDAAAGKIALQAIYPGETLLAGRVADHMGGSTLSAVVEPGKRALTVAVNEVVGVAGFLLPGNRVDIVATRNEGNRRVNARTLLQDLKVLAVDQTTSTEKNDPIVVRAVTLEVTPKQAEILTKATHEGKVQLTLRNPLDEKTIVKEEDDTPKVKPPAPQRAAYRPKVTVIRGTSVSSTTVRN